MFAAWLERVKAQFAAITSVQAIEFKTARQVAFVDERLRNNLLIPTNSRSQPSARPTTAPAADGDHALLY